MAIFRVNRRISHEIAESSALFRHCERMSECEFSWQSISDSTNFVRKFAKSRGFIFVIARRGEAQALQSTNRKSIQKTP
ncbi:hypothetical protein [Helicobacter sp. 23-1045]